MCTVSRQEIIMFMFNSDKFPDLQEHPESEQENRGEKSGSVPRDEYKMYCNENRTYRATTQRGKNYGGKLHGFIRYLKRY